MIHDNKNYTDLKLIQFKTKTASDYNIDIAIKYCSVCASDHHILGGWGETIATHYCHEITGIATKVGLKVTTIKVGDRVGVGAQISSCFECRPCKTVIAY